MSSKTMAIKLVIFDLDGTLVDSLGDLTDATNHMLAALAKPQLSSTEVRKLIGQGARRLVERALQDASGEEVERGLQLFLAYNEANIADKSRLYPAVEETLGVLKTQGRQMAVVSNKNVALCRKLLSVLGVDNYFETIIGADSLPFRKPSPEPVLKLLQDFEMSAEKSAIVGDSLNDIAAGKGAGIMTVGCSYGYGDATEIAMADYRIDTFGDLLQLPPFQKKLS